MGQLINRNMLLLMRKQKGKKFFLIFKKDIRSNANEETIIHAQIKTIGTSKILIPNLSVYSYPP